jgi:hypothetical protein
MALIGTAFLAVSASADPLTCNMSAYKATVGLTAACDAQAITLTWSGQKTDELQFIKVYSNSHYVTPRPTLIQAISGIKQELKWRLDQLNVAGFPLFSPPVAGIGIAGSTFRLLENICMR